MSCTTTPAKTDVDNMQSRGKSSLVSQIRDNIESALEGKLSHLDMDELLEQLVEVETELAVLRIGAEEGETLREDLSSRVQHMVRAISVVEPKRIDQEEELVCETLSADDLIRKYRKLCAVFRDTFGGSLRYLPQMSSSGVVADYSEYRS